jgi:hypothetical protein
MFLRFYYVHYRPWHVRGRVFCVLSDVRGIGFLDVKGCLKFFNGVFRGVFAWEKSMLSALRLLMVINHGYRVLILHGVDGGFYLD